MKLIARLIPFVGFAPLMALAQGGAGNLNGVEKFIDNIVQFMNSTLVPLIFAIAFLIFIWGIFKYFILGSDDEGSRETGRTYMMYGIAGFVIMVSVWGIVNLVAEGFGFSNDKIENIPDLPTKNN